MHFVCPDQLHPRLPALRRCFGSLAHLQLTRWQLAAKSQPCMQISICTHTHKHRVMRHTSLKQRCRVANSRSALSYTLPGLVGDASVCMCVCCVKMLMWCRLLWHLMWWCANVACGRTLLLFRPFHLTHLHICHCFCCCFCPCRFAVRWFVACKMSELIYISIFVSSLARFCVHWSWLECQQQPR